MITVPMGPRRPVMARLWTRLTAKDRGEPASTVPRRGQQIYGWFDHSHDRAPAYAPPADGPCLLCGLPLNSLDFDTMVLPEMPWHPDRRYFFRTHIHCSDRSAGNDRETAATVVAGMIYRNGD